MELISINLDMKNENRLYILLLAGVVTGEKEMELISINLDMENRNRLYSVSFHRRRRFAHSRPD